MTLAREIPRATLLTGTWPAEHGLTLTLTQGGARPDPRLVLQTVRRNAGEIGGSVPRSVAVRNLVRTVGGLGGTDGDEPELTGEHATLAKVLGAAGYHVRLAGKWHLTKPVRHERWSAADTALIERRFGFAGWEPPDAGENTKAENFGGGPKKMSLPVIDAYSRGGAASRPTSFSGLLLRSS